MSQAIEIYNSALLQRNEDGSLHLIAKNRDEAREALAYAWGIGEGVNRMTEQTLWDRGDLLLQLRARYPDLDVGEVIDNTSENEKTVSRLMVVSERFPPGVRRDFETTHSVHAEICQRKGLDAMHHIRILGLAIKHELNTFRTRQLAARVAKTEDKDELLDELEDVLDLKDVLDSTRETRARYLKICCGAHLDQLHVTGHEELPDSGDLIIDMKRKSIVLPNGEERSIPKEE